MIAALDSSFDAPSLAQAEAARAAGVGAWGGYLATVQQPGAFNLAAPWSRQAFENVQQAGLRAIAFCSGLDDPSALRQLAQQWGVLLVLDCEDGIRGDGPWVGPFLRASGAGLYGLLAVHHWPAPFRIAALYPAGGCTGATWPTSPAPAEPHGWQCQGSHQEFGLVVDRSALDDWFGGDMIDQATLDRLLQGAADAGAARAELTLGFQALSDGSKDPAAPNYLSTMFDRVLAAITGLDVAAIKAELDTVQSELTGLSGAGLPPASLQPLQDAIARLSAHLGMGTP